jgi:ferrochelatase
VEVLYDLDVEAAEVCRSVGLPMARAATVNDDPLFLQMMADEVVKTFDRYRTGTPLVLSAAIGADAQRGSL